MGEVYKIKVSQLEGLYLADSISMFQHGPPMEGRSPMVGDMFPGLLLKIGACVLYAETNKGMGDVDLELTEEELWVIREAAKSSVVVGSERVGLKLLVKVYAELLRSPLELSADEDDENGNKVELGGQMEDMLRDALNGQAKDYEAEQ